MHVLIRHVVRKPGGIVERSDHTFDGESLSIGRATDQTIHIPDKSLSLDHSVILAKGAHLSIRANPASTFFVNQPLPAHTLLTISQLAWPGMMVEIDVTAIVPLK